MDKRGLSDEVLLRIASFLDPAALTKLGECSWHFHRLANDSQLWKRHFWHAFVQPGLTAVPSNAASEQPLPTLSGLRSLLLHQKLASDKLVRGDGTGIARLPHRFYRQGSDTPASQLAALFNAFDTEQDSVALDWQQVYRVSTNWQAGNFVSSQLPTPPDTPSLAHSASDAHIIARTSANFVFVSRGKCTDTSPVVEVFAEPSRHGASSLHPDDLSRRSPIGHLRSTKLESLLAQSGNTASPCHITDIAIDIAPETTVTSNKRKAPGSNGTDESLRVLVSYSGGHFALFRVVSTSNKDKSLSYAEEHFHARASRKDVAISALHSSALVLCSKDFDISVYQIIAPSPQHPSTRVELVQQLSSYRSSWPASMRLKRIPYHAVQKSARHSAPLRPNSSSTNVPDEEEAFRLTIAYATPAYPSSWTIGVQEIVLRLCTDPARGAKGSRITSRHANARHAFTSTPIDLRGASMLTRPVDSRLPLPWTKSRSNLATEASRMTSLSYDDPFIVLGASNNVLEVYELYGATTHVRLDRDSAEQDVRRSATATPVSPKDSLRLVHRRILHGHTGGVQSVALEDGRCVSGGADGNVMVWNLGERINEGDSIASVVRRHKRSSRPAQKQATRSVADRSDATSSVDAGDADEAVSMTHVLTLQTPSRNTLDVIPEVDDEEGAVTQTSLHSALASSTRQDTSRGIIRWVSTTFDKIVSIVTYPNPSPDSTDLLPSRERVQIWNFG